MQALENQRQTVLGALPKKQNKFLSLLKEELKGEELQLAIYTLTLQDQETWNDFRPRRSPTAPRGYGDAFVAYSLEKKEEAKYRAWNEIMAQYGEHIRQVDETKAKNLSDLKFLNEMLEMFEAKGMVSYSEIVRSKIYEYDSEP